jgi:hypothetical protein
MARDNLPEIDGVMARNRRMPSSDEKILWSASLR